jgi:thiamine kinase-like enzyme
MRGILENLDPIVAAEELHDALQKVLSDFYSEPVTITQWQRRVSEYSSSYLIEEIDVQVAGRGDLELMFKDLSRNALLIDASRNKPAFCDDSLREIETYRKVLHDLQLGTATFYGAFVDEKTERYWLFLERLEPVHLWQMGEFAVWERVAAWLARSHLRLADCVNGQTSPHLLRHDRDFYQRWIDRAREFVRQRDKSSDRGGAKNIDFIADNYDWVINRLLGLPLTVIHGEFFPSNVLLENFDTEVPRVCAVDWEMAAYGPGLIDLAALISGNWTIEERNAMTEKYYSALSPEVRADWDFETFQIDLNCCRLHQAIQFLGWSRDWTAPPEHAQDWLDEAATIAEQLPL